MESPRFGERWGRHWLDVSRFAESMSLRGILLKHAWRYRDYVIEAFNDDLPYDQFLTQQLAGDLLEASSADAQRQNLIATTFLVMGDALLENQNKSQLDMDVVDVDATVQIVVHAIGEEGHDQPDDQLSRFFQSGFLDKIVLAVAISF